ncbi:exonuclease 1 [Histomonas meleagridis]|uniref:exonuclease 1 n=1 Tax=Histomonas meleagridis TaxID=135588 RepID=UPI003559BBF7|nr:exonuclease 1 [Histomonas meleagridis]KAH0796940.1 exonuclease 1 [Histomonas meleagridis]
MGIQGLLPAVRDATEITNISRFTGKKAGIDGFVWLHRGCLSCGRELAKGLHTTKYISYFMKRIQILIDNRVRPLVVFDGNDLPAKKYTNEKRRQKRAEHNKLAEEFEKRGLKAEADFHYSKSIEITPDVLHPLLTTLKKHNIEFIVAPYEADAQLAFLAYNHIVDIVITEDSDLLVYKCPRTVYKLEQNGNCHLIELTKIFSIKEFSGMTHEMFVECCVLSGCDYLPSIPKMGIRTAAKKMQMYHSGLAIISSLRLEEKWDVPPNYESDFTKACLVFQQQKIFDPSTRTIHGIYDNKTTDITESNITNEQAIGVAHGILNSKTYEPFDLDGFQTPSQGTPNNLTLYSIPVSHSAASEFKPHSSSQITQTLPLKRSSLFNPLIPTKRTSSSQKFIPPSLRLRKI